MLDLPTKLSALEPEIGPPYHFDNVAETFGDLEVNRELDWKSLTDRQRAFRSMKMEIHAAMVDVMDAAIGRILNQLDTMGVADNTIVMFLSDNGASAELMVRGDGQDMNAGPRGRDRDAVGRALAGGNSPAWLAKPSPSRHRHRTNGSGLGRTAARDGRCCSADAGAKPAVFADGERAGRSGKRVVAARRPSSGPHRRLEIGRCRRRSLEAV